VSCFSPSPLAGAAEPADFLWTPGTVLGGSLLLVLLTAVFELVRRKHDLDIVLGLSFQDMSPDTGNWLGRARTARIDADRVFVKDLPMWYLDVSFIWNKFFNEYFGIRYGAGLGLAILPGRIDRISNGNCTADNARSIVSSDTPRPRSPA